MKNIYSMLKYLLLMEKNMDDLSYILEPLNSQDSLARNGIEKEKKQGDFIFREAEYSVRILYEKENNVIAGLHFVKFGDRQIISGIYTLEDEREKGYMSKIIEVARKKYGILEHNQHRTELGNIFVERDENKIKNKKQKL